MENGTSDRPVERSCTGKRAYLFKDKAERVARQREASGAPPLRAYKCPRCPCWHLTKSMLKV